MSNAVMEEVKGSPPLADNQVADTWDGKTHRFEIEGHKVYLNVAWDNNRNLCQIFIRSGKSESILRGSLEALSDIAREHFQKGSTLEDLIKIFERQCYEPAGRTNNPMIPSASSIPNYIAQWLRQEFSAKD